MLKQTVLLLATAFLVLPSAMAADYPTRAFDATYQISNPQGVSQMRMASDGKGHFFTQTSANGQQFRTIIDYLNGTSTTLIEQGKMAMRTKLPHTSSYIADESAIKLHGGKLIGTKVIDGHPCHGYEVINSGVKSQTWVGDDCKVVVQSTSDVPTGKIVMNLKSVSGSPAADIFQIPSGYKMMGM